MKRFLFFLLSITLSAFLAVPVLAEETVSITSRQDLEAIAEAPEGSYRLDADIDMGSADWLPIPFRGSFDGNGHTLYNLRIRRCGSDTAVTVDGNHKGYESGFAGLFSVVRNARIRNLHILGADIQIETGDDCFAAMIAGYFKNSVIQNCTAEGSVKLSSTGVMEGIGGIAGFGVGTIEGCRADAELVLTDRRNPEEMPRPEHFLGGILGCGNSTIRDNRVNIRGVHSCWGYVHDGGLSGMHYRYNPESPNGEICGNQTEGFITFFENNRDRRAYCKPDVGEILTAPAKMEGNQSRFQRDERFQQTRALNPHSCSHPELGKKVIDHTDQAFGYTLEYCKTCGYERRYNYMAPGHRLESWEILKEPDYQNTGRKARRCALCGQIVLKEEIPELVPVSSCVLPESEIQIAYREAKILEPEIIPENASDQTVTWTSDHPEVVTVTEDGALLTHKRGTATIRCASSDGFAASSCQVTVFYTPWQWILKTLFFGWIWY